jgi:hypothetical protein
MNPHVPISRRSWLALTASALAGCGGGGGLALLPGTGGTGIFAQGAIAGFGSVIVNGTRFDDTGAAVHIDGIAATPLDLRLGMVAGVQGQRDAATALAFAKDIDVWSIAQGPVTQVQSGQFLVAGMTIQTGTATVFDGIASASALAPGQAVTVWGLQAGADGSHWVATRVAVLPTAVSKLVSSGLVTSQRTMNGFALRGTVAASLLPGQLVRAKGTFADGGLQVDEFKVLALPLESGTQHEIEVEGVVTQVLSATRFMLGNVEVDSSGAPAPATPIAAGQRIEVYGVLQGQVLKASSLMFETEESLDEADIEGTIEQFTSLANFVVRGQRCDASGALITRGRAADLRVGVRVKMNGTKSGNVLLVTTLSLGD